MLPELRLGEDEARGVTKRTATVVGARIAQRK
jgi:hypothetical protein